MSTVSPLQRTLLRAAVGVWGLYAVVVAAGFAVGDHRRWAQPADATLGSAVEVLVVALLWVRAAGPTRERRAWRTFALAWSFHCASEIALDVGEAVTGGGVLRATGLEIGYVVCYVLLFRAVGMLLWPTRAGGGVGLVTETLGLVLLIGAVVQQFVVRPLAATSVHPVPSISFWVMLTTADVLFAVCAATVAFGARGDPRWWYLAGAMVTFSVGDVLFCVVALQQVYVPGTGLDLFWTGGLLLAATAATRPARPVPLRPLTRRSIMAAPVLVLPSCVLLLFSGFWVPLHLEVGITALAATAAAVVRWFQAQRELLDLAQYRREALTDELTGVPNRRALLLDLEGRVHRHRPFALAIIDLDRFKAVNDGLGHAAGDELLRQLVRRLTTALPAGSVLARLGGDELAVVLPGAPPAEARARIDTAHTAMTGSYDLDGHRVHVSGSIGVAAFPDHARTVSGLLRSADAAMYEAKAEGGVVRAASGTLARHVAAGDRATGDLLRVTQLRTALGLDPAATPAELAQAGRLVLHFQPQVDLADGAVVGAEALVRWEHPGLGTLPPAEFLHLVESQGLLHGMTVWALDEALAASASWAAAGHDLRVAVNLSAGSLRDAGLRPVVAGLLERHGRPADRLQLEVTESVAMTDHHGTTGGLGDLAALGVSLSIDDFGTGYSSLAYLQELAFDEVKLDRTFVAGIVRDTRSAAIAASTVWLAHEFEVRIVAEGIEDEPTRAFLADLGCDVGQGFLHARPMSAPELLRWLAARPTHPATTRAPRRTLDLTPGTVLPGVTGPSSATTRT